MTVDELRKELIKRGVSKELVAKSKKKELESMLSSLDTQETEDEKFNMDSAFEEDQPVACDEEPSETLQDAMPSMGSAEWNEKIMSLFEPSELVDGYPTCAGLRRMAHDILGEITSSRPTQVNVAPDSGYASVVYEIEIDWKLNVNIANIFHSDNMNRSKRVFGGSADCSPANTPEKFANHAVATAETRAEGRALRKALMINKITAEEASSEGMSVETMSTLPISPIVKKMVKVRMKDLDIMEKDLLSEIGVTDRPIDDLTREEGKELLKVINKKQ